MQRTIIAVWGPSNVGKTTTIGLTFQKLVRLATKRFPLASKRQRKGRETNFIIEIDGVQVGSLLGAYDEATLIKKLVSFAKIIDEEIAPPKKLEETIKKYRDLSAKHTTHPGRRTDRQVAFVKSIQEL